MPRAYRHLQLSFAGGEMAPEMFARLRDVSYGHGAAKLQNFLSLPQGPARKRPGTRFVREVKRHWWNVASVNTSTDTITLTIDHDFVTGDVVTFSAAGGVPAPLNEGQNYFVIVTGVDEFKVATTRDNALSGVAIDLTSIGTTVWVFSRNKQKVRLQRFQFGVDDTLCLEIGRTLVDSRFIGYFRLHTGGSTVTYGTPPEYVETQTASALDTVTNQLTLTTSPTDHNLQTGDPVALTMRDTFAAGQQTVTFNTTTNVVNHTAHGWSDGQAVLFTKDGTGVLPNEIEEGRVYYVYLIGDANAYRLMTARFTAPLEFSGSPTGTTKVVGLPGTTGLSGPQIDPKRVYYAIRISLEKIQLAYTKADAMTGDEIDFANTGTVSNLDIRVHYAYEPGDLVTDSGIPGVFYAIRRPWEIHLDPPTTNTDFWFRQQVTPDILDVPHFYAQEVLFELQMFQSNDVVTIVHRDRPVAELRRLSATKWVLKDVVFNGALPAPEDIMVFPTEGQGHKPTNVSSATPAVFTTEADHNLADGEIVMAENIGFGVADGIYIVSETPTNTTFSLSTFTTGEDVSSSGGTPPANARIRPTTFASDWDETYAVTAIRDDTGEESPASVKVTATNNLLVPGAFNTISWRAVEGADRYRIYKEQLGLFGFIGEVEAGEGTLFEDDNIGPDLSRTLPMLDRSLYRSAAVGVDAAEDLILWEDHGLVSGDPVIFTSDGTMPGGIEAEKTYYVLDASPDGFTITTTPGGAVLPISSAGTGTRTARGGKFPGAGCYFEGRRCFGGAHTSPQHIWMTGSGTESDMSYSIPVVDDDRISLGIAARELSLVRHLVPLGHLLALTSSTEYRITSLDSGFLTPGSAFPRAPTHIGAASATPAVVNNIVLFVAARGGHLREMGLQEVAQDYVTGDISLRATHLFDGFTLEQVDYARAPRPIVWAVSSTGTLLGLTYAPEERIGAWHRHVTSGDFESVAAVPEGDEDRLYVVVERTVLGSPVRYVEEMGAQEVSALEDKLHVDAAVTYDGSATTTVPGLEHLEGETVGVLADGVDVGSHTVVNGQITLATAASKVHVGLLFPAQLNTLPLGMQVDAALGSGRTKNISRVLFRVIESGQFRAGPFAGSTTKSPAPKSGQMFEGLVSITVQGDWSYEGQVWVEQTSPMPLTIASMTLEVASGD